MLKTSMPEKFQYYKAEKETFGSSNKVFRSALPKGFAWEVLGVYSGPPVIVFKFRHWGYMEGLFKGHAPTGELVEFFGVAIRKDGINLSIYHFLCTLIFLFIFLHFVRSLIQDISLSRVVEKMANDLN